MVLILRNIIKKLYNFTEGQDIPELCYIEVASDKIVLEGCAILPPSSELHTAEEGAA